MDADQPAVLGEAAVEHVGVGDVFVVAGQSNSSNHGQEKQITTTGLVAAFDGKHWQLANDPQPGASGDAGSFMPPFGDAMAGKFQVPVGIIACGIGATSVREWLPKGAKFPNPPTLEGRVRQLPSGEWESKGEAFEMFTARMKQLGPKGFRAVLWHQGESDAGQPDPKRTLPGKLYRDYLEQLIRASRREIGWDAPWFVALVSSHGGDGVPDIRAGEKSLWDDGIAMEGPDSDALKGDLRDGVYFSGKGLREHGARWAGKVAPWLEKQTGAPASKNRKPALSRAKLGMFVHYVCGLTPASPQGGNIDDLNAFAAALNVDALAELTRQSGAEYLIFTAYHARIRMLYPSKVWSEVFPDKVSRRDLIGDLADACKKKGISFVLYVHPNDRHDLNTAEQQKLIDLGWAESILTKDAIWIDKEGDLADTGRRGTDQKWNKMYFRTIEEIGARYGSRIAGYWQDGPGPDGITVRGIMLKHTPDAAIWLNSCASRADLPPANLLGGEYIVHPATKADQTTSPTTTLQNAITLNGDWMASGNAVQYPAESLYRMTVTMAASAGQENGGFVLAAGPYSNNEWAPGMVDTLKTLGTWMKRNGPSIYGTVPSTAFVTTSTENQPAWGVATQATNGATVYAHILHPPKEGNRVVLGIPKDGCRFSAANVLGGKAPVKLELTPTGIAVTLPQGASWDPLDTVIVLTVAR